MKKPDEIKKDIIDCMDEAIVVSESGDAHDLLDFSDKAHVCMAVTLTYIQQLEAELVAVKRERDATVSFLHGDCGVCMFQQTAMCDSCRYGVNPFYEDDYWEWEGVCPENTEVQDEN